MKKTIIEVPLYFLITFFLYVKICPMVVCNNNTLDTMPPELLCIIAERTSVVDWQNIQSSVIWFSSSEKNMQALMCVNKAINKKLIKFFAYFPSDFNTIPFQKIEGNPIHIKDHIDMQNYLNCKEWFCIAPIHWLFHDAIDYEKKISSKKIIEANINVDEIIDWKISYFLKPYSDGPNIWLKFIISSVLTINTPDNFFTNEGYIVDIVKKIKNIPKKDIFSGDLCSNKAFYLTKALDSESACILFLIEFFSRKKDYALLVEMLKAKRRGISLERIYRSFSIQDELLWENIKELELDKKDIVQSFKKTVREEYSKFTREMGFNSVDEQNKFFKKIKEQKVFKDICDNAVKAIKIKYETEINNDLYIYHKFRLMCETLIFDRIIISDNFGWMVINQPSGNICISFVPYILLSFNKSATIDIKITSNYEEKVTVLGNTISQKCIDEYKKIITIMNVNKFIFCSIGPCLFWIILTSSVTIFTVLWILRDYKVEKIS